MNLDDYVGLPWRERGRDRTGLDCWGLLRLVYAERMGVTLPSFSDAYVTTEDGKALSDLMDGNMTPWREIEPGQERPGDALLMSLAGHPQHVGVICGGGMVLHIERGTGSIVESYFGYRLRRRVVGFYRFKGS